MFQKEGQIALAIHNFKEGQIATLMEAYRLYGVLYSVMLGRVNSDLMSQGPISRSQHIPPFRAQEDIEGSKPNLYPSQRRLLL